MRVANFMDSSLLDLKKKGVIANAPGIYNPEKAFERVIHFTPYKEDLELQAYFEASRITLVEYRSGEGGKYLSTLRSLWRVWKVLGAEKVQLVRGRLPYLGSLIGLIAARLLGLPFVVSLGGDNRIVQLRNGTYYYNSRFVSYAMEHFVLRFADRVIVPNEFTKRYVADIIGPRRTGKKAVVIPWLSTSLRDRHPVSLDEFDLPEGSRIIPIIGFINRYKYSDVVFDALDQLGASGDWPPDVVFCFCGDGPLKEEGMARFAGRDDVRFLGWLNHDVIAAFILKSACVLVPMSGLVLLEAASAGKPVITSNVEWHAELVTAGETGLVVDATSPHAWHGAIAQLLRDPERASKMGRNLQVRYERDYSAQRSVTLERELYLSLIEERT